MSASSIELNYGLGATPLERNSTDGTSGNVDMDGIHDSLSPFHVSPAQLYSTESGRLFHAGKLCIVLCGLPARGKTHYSVSLTRYLLWLGVKTHPFHLGDYRRFLTTNADADELPPDFFVSDPSTETKEKKARILRKCLNDMNKFFKEDRGQVAIFDAVNGTVKERKNLIDEFKKINIKPLFIETLITDPEILLRNIKEASNSPDYYNWDNDSSIKDYLSRVETKINSYEEINEKDLSFIKIINFGQKLIVNNSQYGYLLNRIVFFLLNTRLKSGSVYFARAGESIKQFNTNLKKIDETNSELIYKLDPSLSENGLKYAHTLTDTIMNKIKIKQQSQAKWDRNAVAVNLTVDQLSNFVDKSKFVDPQDLKSDGKVEAGGIGGRQTPHGHDGINDDSFVVWTSPRLRTAETAQFFKEVGIITRQRSQLTQLNPGDAEKLTDEEIKKKFPTEFAKHEKDPYHHRYPRAESYHDLAVRMEPLILEMERMYGDILVIAHESVLRVLYGYLMACSVNDIPFLSFPEEEIVEISYNAYSNSARRINIG